VHINLLIASVRRAGEWKSAKWHHSFVNDARLSAAEANSGRRNSAVPKIYGQLSVGDIISNGVIKRKLFEIVSLYLIALNEINQSR